MSKLIICHLFARGDSIFLEGGGGRIALGMGNKPHPDSLTQSQVYF